MSKYILTLLVLLLSNSAHAESVVQIKLSSANWDKNTFNLSGNRVEFKKANNFSKAIEYNYIFKNGIAIGYVLSFQEWGVISDSAGSNTPSADFSYGNLIGKYIFAHNSNIRPYLGISSGTSTVHTYGSTKVLLECLSYHAMVGVSFLFSKRIGLNLGYTKGYVDVDDVNGYEIKSFTDALHLGLEIHF